MRRLRKAEKARLEAEARQNADDVYTAQRMSEITDGSSREITKRGVKQRGTSDAEAGTMIRQELGSRQSSPATTGTDSYSPTGFKGASSKQVPGFQLRTESERQARIADSPLSVTPRLVSSTKVQGEMIADGRNGDFSAAQSRDYAKRAQEGGFGSARPAPAAAPTAAASAQLAPKTGTLTPTLPSRNPQSGVNSAVPAPAPVMPAAATPSGTMTPSTTSWGSAVKPLSPPPATKPKPPHIPMPQLGKDLTMGKTKMSGSGIGTGAVRN